MNGMGLVVHYLPVSKKMQKIEKLTQLLQKLKIIWMGVVKENGMKRPENLV